MDTKLVASSLILLLMVSSLLGFAFAQAQALPGVAVGDTFTYENTVTWTSKNPLDFPPAYLANQNGTTLQVAVLSVTGSTVQLQKTLTWRNGTSQTDTELDEVNSGITGTVLLYAANLTAGNLLFPGSTELPYTINETAIRAYAESYRETNHISANNTGAEGSTVAYSLMDLYFDRQTGMCVEYYLTTVYTDSPNQAYTQHLQLKGTSLWKVSNEPISTPTGNPTANPTVSTSASPSETPSSPSTTGVPMELLYVVIVILVVVIAVFGLLFLRKGKTAGEKQQPKQAETTG
jgi:hypothetical protein